MAAKIVAVGKWQLAGDSFLEERQIDWQVRRYLRRAFLNFFNTTI
ncbi:MAG: hypothetical protein AAB316_06260 [Bacteroidota bacterium]